MRSSPPLLALAVLLCAGAAAVADASWGGWFADGPALLAAAAGGLLVGAWCGPGVGGAAVLAGAGLMTVSSQVREPDAYTPANDLVFFLIVIGAPALLGASWAARNRQISELQRLSRLREEQREADLHAARLEEHNRIAVRVQQEVIEAMSAIAVHAGGAGQTGAADLDRSLARIEESARAALDRLRGHLGTLRESGSPAPGPPVAPLTDVPSRRLRAVDVLAAASAVPIAVEAVLGGASLGPAVPNVLLALAMAVPLGLRRRLPFAATVVFLALCVLMSATLTPLPGTVSIIAPLLLFAYTAGAHVHRWPARLSCLALLVLGTIAVALVSPASSRDPEGFAPTLVCLALGFLGGVVSAGRAAHVRRLAGLLEEIEHGRAAEVRLVAARQRQDVARDLHDSVAAAMTVVCVHAVAAQRLSADQDHERRAALTTITEAARTGIAELRTSLDVLDGHPDPMCLRLASVVAEARRAGVPVDLLAPDPLDGVLGEREHLAARVVREALVNVTRHAPGARVEITVQPAGEGVRVVITDSGAASQAPGVAVPGTGHGLRGLAERLSDVGGRMEFGPRTRGFRVAAWIPVAVKEPA